MRIIVIIILLIISNAFAANNEELTKRIEEIEKQQEEIFLLAIENSSPVKSYFNDNLRLGGFFEPAFTGIASGPSHTQVYSSSNTLGLNLTAEYSDKFKFVSQILTGLSVATLNQNNNPNATTLGLTPQVSAGPIVFGAVLTQGFVDYSINHNTNLMGGIGYTPFGYAFQQRELVLFPRRGGPQTLRTTELVVPLWTGLNLAGSYAAKSGRWGYSTYTFSPSLISRSTDFNTTKYPGLGARIWKSSLSDRATLGMSGQGGGLNSDKYQTLGADIRFNFPNWILTSEYARNFKPSSEDPWSAYVQPEYRINDNYLVYTFVDYSENLLNQLTVAKTVLKDPFRKLEYGAGLNWLPMAVTRFRLGFAYNDYTGQNSVINEQKRDYSIVDLSAGITF